VFLLGAGGSYRSGVPLAADATHRIAREAYARQQLGANAVATVKPSDYMRFLRRQPWFSKGVDAFPRVQLWWSDTAARSLRSWTISLVLGVTQARVSELKRGKIDRFSMDLLVRLAARAGLKPKLKLAA
jgi:helix-turn-helix protein